MSAPTATALPARQVRKSRLSLGRRAIVALVLLAAAACGVGLLMSQGGNGDTSRAHTRVDKSFTAGDGSFSVSYPAGWKAAAAGTSAAVIQRTDHNGVVMVRERPPLRGSLANLVKGLPGELRKRFPDFHPVGASAARLSTGPAVVYTFVRTKTDTVQTIVIAPTARRSFTLEVVAPGKAHDAAREAGQIVRSLKAR
jgi:hypothetical protein